MLEGTRTELKMSRVTLKLRFLLPSWLRVKRKERRQSEDSENYVDFMWTFRKDYENCYENVPFEKTQDNIYDDVPFEALQDQIYDDVPLESETSTLERTAMFEDIRSFLDSQLSLAEDNEQDHPAEDNTEVEEQDRTSEHSFAETITAEQKEQLLLGSILQGSGERRAAGARGPRGASLV